MALSAAAERFLSGPMLAEVDADARLALSKALVEARAPSGTPLIEQGRLDGRLWFLVEGTVAVVRRVGDEDQVLARFAAPGIFGATWFFRPNPPTASIRATSNVGRDLSHRSITRATTGSAATEPPPAEGLLRSRPSGPWPSGSTCWTSDSRSTSPRMSTARPAATSGRPSGRGSLRSRISSERGGERRAESTRQKADN